MSTEKLLEEDNNEQAQLNKYGTGHIKLRV